LANRDANDHSAGVTPPAAPAEPAAAEPNPTLREWFVRNGPSLVIMAALFLFLYAKFDTEGLWSIVKAALGLGLVIFIHELGHFAVAKWCDVHVETFSIGFGPALPGCKFQYGETTYMIALFPLGGYVKMVGEGSDSEETDDDPRSFKNKSVWQRMAIISAGVIMNIILAFICFIAVFRGPGKIQPAGVVGMVVAGSSAWDNKIPGGADVRRTGSEWNPFFTGILPQVMLSSRDEEIPFVYTLPPEHPEPIEVMLRARKEKGEDRPVIGIMQAERLQTPPRRHLKSRDFPAFLHSAAAKADPAFGFEDTIIGCSDPKHPEKAWTELSEDPRNDQAETRHKDYFEFARRLQDLAGKPVTVRVRPKNGEEVSIKVPAAYHYTFGLHMRMGQITAVRKNSKGQTWQTLVMGDGNVPDQWKDSDPPVVAGDNRAGDIIQGVEVPEPNGKRTRFVFPPTQPKNIEGKPIDPCRLRFELQEWARRWGTKGKDDLFVQLHVLRQTTDKNSEDIKPVTLRVLWKDKDTTNNIDWKYAREVPFAATAPQPIPELGIAFQVMTTVAGVDPSWPAVIPPPLKEGDEIKQVRFWYLNKDGQPEDGPWTEVKPDQWAWVNWAFEHSTDIKKIMVKVVKAGSKKETEVTLKAKEDETWPMADRGLILARDERIQRADSIGGAILLGLKDTKDKILQVYGTLRGIITSRISPKNLGGPITIARVAFNIAGENFWEFVYFLGLISINLAVVNFLPIPVLDGGHMVFLIYEKIRGKPASEQVRSGATIVGILLLASLMIFVIYLDVSRIVGK
jgi:regulator of sigma E protease